MTDSLGDPLAARKDALRTVMREARSGQIDQHGDAIARHGLELARGHEVVATYGSIGHEPDTWPLIQALHERGVLVLLPVLAHRRSPDWAPYAGREALRTGWHGILEPTTEALGAAGLAQASLVITSALAVADDGHRLGVGGGWFDRALAHARPDALVHALCFETERVALVPFDEHDRVVGGFLTPGGFGPLPVE